jgi:hypothetical protein
MRAFLIAFVCLSTLAMAQNVVVATPLPRGDGGVSGAVRVDPATTEVVAVAPREAPDPAAMGLLVVGLSGLCAVGNRRSAPRRRQTA